jgi:ATP-dependent DNA helicase RecG
MTDGEQHIPRDGATIRPRAFWRALGRLEHERLEFKRSANHLGDAIPAMAMSEGGLIVVGVSDERELVGRPLDQQTLDRITAAACACGVEVRVRAVRVGRVPLTLVLVPAVRDRIVTTADGRLLRRVGATNQPLRGDAVSRFVRARLADALASPERGAA